jgi:NitT/TauT family transport system ATP-binding protein
LVIRNDPFLVLSGASRSFAAARAVDAVSLTLAAGSLTALVGPSGCGKTTLLRILGGIEPLDAGTLQRAPGAFSFCFQEPRLLPWATVCHNVALPLRLAGVARAEREDRAREALKLVQLSDAAGLRPHQLSGGMKMRTALARALVGNPRLLLLDEPFSALDEVTRQELDLALRQLWEQARFTAVIVTHSLPEAAFVAERVLVLSPRPARIVADLATPTAVRDRSLWTSPELNAVVAEASRRLHGAIAEARR